MRTSKYGRLKKKESAGRAMERLCTLEEGIVPGKGCEYYALVLQAQVKLPIIVRYTNKEPCSL